MELRHLRYFVAVAEELHFGRAADRLHMSQPPLSQQIHNLEEELGLKLFLRRNRRVELTHAGRVFLGEAKQILARMERAADAAKRADRGKTGPLVVACGPLAMKTILPMALKIFRTLSPEVELCLRQSTMQEMLESLQDRTTDVGLLTPSFESTMLQSQMVLTVPVVAAVPKSHPLAQQESIKLKELKDERFVLYSHRSAPGFHVRMIELCRRAGFAPKITQEAGQYPELLVLVTAGYGVALVPELRDCCVPEGVSLVRIEETWATIQLGMAWRAGNSSPVLAAFLDVIKSCTPEVLPNKPSRRPPAKSHRRPPNGRQ